MLRALSPTVGLSTGAPFRPPAVRPFRAFFVSLVRFPGETRVSLLGSACRFSLVACRFLTRFRFRFRSSLRQGARVDAYPCVNFRFIYQLLNLINIEREISVFSC